MVKQTPEQAEIARQKADVQVAKAKQGAEASADYEANAKAINTRSDKLKAERLARAAATGAQAPKAKTARKGETGI